MPQQILWTIGMIVAYLTYAFVIMATFAIVGVLPFFLIALMALHLRTHKYAAHILITSLVAAGFLIGCFLGWTIRPSEWGMPFWETLYAGGNAEKYGHAIESRAERIFLYYVLYPGVFGSLVAGVGGAMIKKVRIPFAPVGWPRFR